ncbi:PH domain-containing protein [Solitalea sp. MAHUQ-68]|uniref:PH domain-containing protein n=1 Tax=Solitalea agri TaxID=2953739 RepID=A0A9X2F4R3_9SPHI|nr:PH domain-containing protein [Solitalea agri]MCO4294169.1 PH domain-containing protein [Solitalea agri]
MKSFKASLDLASKIITAISGILFIGIIILILLTGEEFINVDKPTGLLMGSGLLILFIGLYLYHPTEYLVDDSFLIIKRPIGKLKIERRIFLKVNLVTKAEMGFTIRTFGNGGLFGYTGWFSNSLFGSMRWYATQRKNFVLIETSTSGKIVVTPDEQMDFAKSIAINDTCERFHDLCKSR